MTFLVLDTCVWFDLATKQYSVLQKLSKLLAERKVTIVLPQTVKNEWGNLREKLEKKINRDVVVARDFIKEYRSLLEDNEFNTPFEELLSIDPGKAGREIFIKRLNAVNDILDSSKVIHLPVSEQSKMISIDHALDKKAPFKNKNSMADALIFFSAVEWANNDKPESSFFITHNITDFSDETDKMNKNKIAPELEPYLSKNQMNYSSELGRVLNEIEEIVTNEEIEVEKELIEDKRAADELYKLYFKSQLKTIQENNRRLNSILNPLNRILEKQKILNNPFDNALQKMHKLNDPRRKLADQMKLMEKKKKK